MSSPSAHFSALALMCLSTASLVSAQATVADPSAPAAEASLLSRAQAAVQQLGLCSCMMSVALSLLLLPLSLLLWRLLAPSRSLAVTPLQPGEKPAQTNAKHSPREADVVIVGAGVAGASLGAVLAARGHRVVVVEQSLEEPQRIVGELLQPSGVTLLRQMGLAETLEGFDAQRVFGYGIFHREAGAEVGDMKMLKLEYPRDERGEIHEGRSFHNGRFLGALRRAATARGAELRQGTVTRLAEDESGRVSGVHYRCKDGSTGTVNAALTVVCDGLFSSFRAKVTTNTFQTRSKFLGLILKLRREEYPTPQGGHVFLAQPTPILLYPISTTEGRMLIDFPDGVAIPADKEELKSFLLSHTRAQLPAKIHSAFDAAVREGGFQQMPNRQLGARPARTPGVLTLGDAFNVRHPLTGGGMTVVFTDVALFLARVERELKDWGDHKAVDALVANHYSQRNAPVSAINILADALYDVFGAKYADLRAACYDYLSQGGEQSAGPIRLLSGVSRSQALLVSHFFAVALWGIKMHCWPIPRPRGVLRCYRMLQDACTIILPLLQSEHPGLGMSLVASVLRTVFWVPYKSYVFPAPKY